jgi:hypothetical protein
VSVTQRGVFVQAGHPAGRSTFGRLAMGHTGFSHAFANSQLYLRSDRQPILNPTKSSTFPRYP